MLPYYRTILRSMSTTKNVFMMQESIMSHEVSIEDVACGLRCKKGGALEMELASEFSGPFAPL